MPTRSRQGHDKSGYLSEDTIAAIATATGGAISMVRVSGPSALSAADTLAPGIAAIASKQPRKLFRTTLKDPDGEALDDALIGFFKAPQSFTGEDVVELHLHGGSYLASRVIEEFAAIGVRQALPGEFSFRAVRNGKMSVSQAQAVADLISASNDGAIRLALEKMSGTENRLLQDLAEKLRKLAVFGELGIDFADQDVDEVSLPTLKTRLPSLIETLKVLASTFERGHRLQDGVGVAFVGLPNAGKSSFFNAILGEDRSIVSDVAGTTRDVVREKISLKGHAGSVTLRLEDTAGLRSTENPVEQMGIERTQRVARDADLVLFVVDATEASEHGRLLISEQWAKIASPSSKTLGILTKCDLATAEQIRLIKAELAPLGIASWTETSAVTGSGMAAAIEAIVAFSAKWTSRARGEVLLTRIEQLRAVREALDHLIRAASAAELDLFASDIRQALHALGPLIGETPTEEILGQIFSDFCIGK